ncbi:MAG: AarF/ABC1/UbiB kinase family protein [Nocardioidaceae bacterium]|nr:AarF/ABC1/UbiB kinase family protein [Nocardioidaceae bacterium]
MSDTEEEARKPLPRRAAARTARLASLPIGYAGRTTLGLGKRLVGRPAEAVVSDVQMRTAEQLFRVLGELKGGAMKFGQALSVFEAALPDELAGPYRETLTRLQDAAPPMDRTAVHTMLAQELGPRWRKLFLSFDDDPAAAASIGQVHRAVWHDGREVAVKVQYPGAGEAMRADLRQIARAAKVFGSALPNIDVKPLVEELQARVGEELDYRLEADAQHRFHEAFADDSEVVVPAVVEGSERVLVTTWMDSVGSLARLIAEGDQETRNHFGTLYVRFMFSGPDRAGMLHADPHPGNFRMLADGRLGVVDYGAVARLPDRSLPPVIGRLLRAAVDDDWPAVLDGLRDEGFVKPGVDLDVDVLRDYLTPFIEPAMVPTFTFNRAWMREQAERIANPRQEAFATATRINMPPSYLLIHRVWIGGIGVLSQLGAEADFRSLLEDSLPGFAD